MPPRRMVDVSEETHERLRVLAFVTSRRMGALVGEAIEALLAADPQLAAQVEQLRQAGGPPPPAPKPPPARPPPRTSRRGEPRLPVGPGHRAGR